MLSLLTRSTLVVSVVCLTACGRSAAGVSDVLPAQGSTLSVANSLMAAHVDTVLPHASESRSAQSAYGYTAPWGGFSNTQIYVEPAGPCSYIPASLAAEVSWPSFLNGLRQGTKITLYGTPSYDDTWSQKNGCPTGGIVVTSVALGTGSPAPVPAPVPTATPGGSINNVAPDYDPPASWRPYKSTSTWNQRLSNVDAPALDPSDRSKISAMFNGAFGSNVTQGRIATPELTALAENKGGGGFPYYFARASDPLISINCTANYGSCAIQGKSYHVPAKAAYAQDTDHHMVIVQPDGTELDVWEWGLDLRSSAMQNPPWYSHETVNVGWGSVTGISNGTGWESGLTASGADGLAGLVRVPELASGHINHALTANVYCSPTPTFVYPAQHGSGSSNCNGFQMSADQGTPMGSRLWIDLTDAQIASLSNFNRAQKTILYALHEYGAFVTDNSGYDPLAFGEIESQIPGAVYGSDPVGAWASLSLPQWFSWQGLTWYYVLSGDDMSNYIQPHLHVLAPCVNIGFPGSRC